MKSPGFINTLKINGLNYFRNFEISIEHPFVILVGDNGMGKTTILNILFSVLSQNWLFLTKCAFDKIEITFSGQETVSFLHCELDAFLIETRYPDTVNTLFIDKSSVSKFKKIEKTISKYCKKGQIIYLPTYRRIRIDINLFKGHSVFVSNVLPYYPSDEFADEEFRDVSNQILMPEKFNLTIGNEMSRSRILKFMTCCNSYLVNTELKLNKRSNEIILVNKTTGEEVQISQLSSGEEQIVFVFARLFLTTTHHLIILYDEPELSLSLPWQRKLLPDIVSSGYCGFLFAITHSPFVFDNELDKYAEGISAHIN